MIGDNCDKCHIITKDIRGGQFVEISHEYFEFLCEQCLKECESKR